MQAPRRSLIRFTDENIANFSSQLMHAHFSEVFCRREMTYVVKDLPRNRLAWRLLTTAP
jgi:hypothetical protein